MKSILAALAFTSIAAGAGAQSFQPAKLPAASRDSFEVMFQGQVIGTFVTNLTRVGDSFSFTGTTTIPSSGMVQGDSMMFNATTLAPSSINSRMSMQGMSANSAVTITGGKATGSMQMPGPAGIQTMPVSATIAAGVIADGTEVALLPTVDLNEKTSMSFQAFDPAKGETKTSTLQVLARESLTIPLGTFDVYRIKSSDDAVIFVTVAEPHRIMAIQIVKQGIEMRRAK